ncbi:MFS transporter [Pendulispora brunnea]|uniref:MFS transporter n=1 Tax=Pendulispora brunnea TaxID=2905690 RepID=A0ABZ2K0X1_9BACT
MIRFLRDNPIFARLWIGQLLCQSSTRMFQIAMMWWALGHAQTHPGLTGGVLLLMGVVPSVVLVNRIGRTVEKTPFRSLLLRCDAFAALTSGAFALLAYFGYASVPLLFVVVLLLATYQGFYDPTLNRAAPQLVPGSSLEKAVAFLTSTQSVASFTGAVLGALVIERLGLVGTALLNVAGYSASFVFNRMLPRPEPAPTTEGEPPPAGAPDEEGAWRSLRRFPFIRSILLAFAAVNFFGTPSLIVLPTYVKWTLHGTAATLATVEACMWLGLIAGTFGAGKIAFGGSNTVRLSALCIACMGLAVLVPGLTIGTVVYAAALACVGAALGVNNVKMVSWFQQNVPASHKGRFFAAMQAVCAGATPLAFAIFGQITDTLGPARTCLVQAAGILVVSAWIFLLSRRDAASATDLRLPEAT